MEGCEGLARDEGSITELSIVEIKATDSGKPERKPYNTGVNSECDKMSQSGMDAPRPRRFTEHCNSPSCFLSRNFLQDDTRSTTFSRRYDKVLILWRTGQNGTGEERPTAIVFADSAGVQFFL